MLNLNNKRGFNPFVAALHAEWIAIKGKSSGNVVQLKCNFMAAPEEMDRVGRSQTSVLSCKGSVVRQLLSAVDTFFVLSMTQACVASPNWLQC